MSPTTLNPADLYITAAIKIDASTVLIRARYGRDHDCYFTAARARKHVHLRQVPPQSPVSGLCFDAPSRRRLRDALIANTIVLHTL